MSEVPYGPFMKTAPGEPPKRVFGDITNAGKTTTGPPKPTLEPPKKKQYVGGWTEKDRASSKPHSDATEGSLVVRRTYDLRLVVQGIHAPQIAEDVTFYEIEAPNAAKAAKARKSGEGVTFEPTPEYPLRWPPVDGGVCHAMHVPETSSDVVGVNEIMSAGAKKSNKVKARSKLTQSRPAVHGSAMKGMTFAPSFSVWFDGKLVGKYKGKWQSALPDIRQKRPGKTLTQEMLSCLLGIKKEKLLRKKPCLKKQLKETKFTAEYDD